MSQDETPKIYRIVNARDQQDEKAELIGRMCDKHNISTFAVPAQIEKVPAAIEAILIQRAKQDKSRGVGMGM